MSNPADCNRCLCTSKKYILVKYESLTDCTIGASVKVKNIQWLNMNHCQYIK